MPDLNRKIIVSADDFGKNSSTNKNILELLSLKKLQRISVMVNGTFSAEEIRLLLASPAQLDLHLNFFNLLKKDHSLETEINILSRSLDFFRNYLSGKIKTSQVEKDWLQQLEKFRTIFGKNPDGLNSHEHVHFFPPYFKLISTLTQKSKINYLRSGKKGFIKTNNIVSWIIFCLRRINQRRFLTSGLNSSDFLVSLDWLGENVSEKIKLRAKRFNCPTSKHLKTFSTEIKNLPAGEIELIVHPEITAELEFLKTQGFDSFI